MAGGIMAARRSGNEGAGVPEGFFFFNVQFSVRIVLVCRVNGKLQRQDIILNGFLKVVPAFRHADDNSFFRHLANTSVRHAEYIAQDGGRYGQAVYVRDFC